MRWLSTKTANPPRGGDAKPRGRPGQPGYRTERQHPRRSKTSRIIAAVAVIGAIGAGGAAFTASNTVPASVAGYGTSTISGATVSALSYTRSADGATITAANLTLDGDQSARTIKAAFNTDALSDCTAGVYDEVALTTPVTCSGFTQDTAAADAFHVAVS